MFLRGLECPYRPDTGVKGLLVHLNINRPAQGDIEALDMKLEKLRGYNDAAIFFASSLGDWRENLFWSIVAPPRILAMARVMEDAIECIANYFELEDVSLSGMVKPGLWAHVIGKAKTNEKALKYYASLGTVPPINWTAWIVVMSISSRNNKIVISRETGDGFRYGLRTKSPMKIFFNGPIKEDSTSLPPRVQRSFEVLMAATQVLVLLSANIEEAPNGGTGYNGQQQAYLDSCDKLSMCIDGTYDINEHPFVY